MRGARYPQKTHLAALRQGALHTFVLGVFVSATSTGTLALPWILDGALVLCCIPVTQALAVGALARLAGVKASWSTVVVGYWSTHRPWAVLLLALSAIAVASPDHQAFLVALSMRGWLAGAFLAAFAWSAIGKGLFFRRELGLSVARTALVLVGLTFVYLAVPLVFLVVTRQLPIAVLRGYL